jgi:signal transduction histidine kinase/PAS domain-containing protein
MIKPATTLLEDLYRFIDRLSAARGLANVLEEALSAAMTLTGSEMGTITPYRSSTRSYGMPVYQGFPDDYVEHMAQQRVPVKDGPRERAFESRKRVVVPDVYEDPAFTPFLPWVRRAGFLSMQATPIISRYGESVGTICTFQRAGHVPTEEQLDLFDVYGKLVADAIERENTEATLTESEERFRLLYELMARISRTEDLQSALGEVLSAAIDLTGAEAGNIRLLDPITGKYPVVTSQGLDHDTLAFAASQATEFLLRSPGVEAIQEGRRIVVDSLEAYPPLQAYSRVVRATGFTSMQATPLFNHAGVTIGSISTFFGRRQVPPLGQLDVLDLYAQLAADAIDRLRTTNALSESEERLRLAIQGARAYPWELDLKSNLVWYAGNLEHIGAPPPGSSFRRLLRLVHPDDRSPLLRAFRDAKCGNAHFEVEVRSSDHAGESGASLWFRISAELLVDQDGQTERFVGTAKEITAHKKTESKRRKSEERFRRLHGLMVRLSGTSGYQDALDEVLGATLEVLGTDIGDVRLRRGQEGNMDSIAASRGMSNEFLSYISALPPAAISKAPAFEALQSRKITFVEDVASHQAFVPHIEAFRKAGVVSVLAVPLISQRDERVGSIAAMFREKTLPTPEQLQVLELYASLAADAIEREEQREDQARTEQSLRKAIAVKDEFLGMVSHELRTPMTVIRGLSSVLNRNPDLSHEALEETYRDLRSESDRLYHLIENMLALARVEAGQRRSTELVLVDKVIESIVATLRAESPDMVLVVRPLPRHLVFQIVPQYLAQILHNLVENARKYSPPGSEIELGATEKGSWVEISVADRGIGIKDPGALFQPFGREDHAEKMASGMGLGLSVCRTLVEAQSGRIWAEQRPGGGSVFSFTLPI